tara:strand:+ start:702 stop:878 length:177 start_codon:yes stop_codon:yes gene_type:complete
VKKNKRKGIPMFAGYNSMKELLEFTSSFNGSEGVVAMTVMMQTLQTIDNIEKERNNND